MSAGVEASAAAEGGTAAGHHHLHLAARQYHRDQPLAIHSLVEHRGVLPATPTSGCLLRQRRVVDARSRCWAACRNIFSTTACAPCSAARIRRLATSFTTERCSNLPAITATCRRRASRTGPRRRARSSGRIATSREDFFLGRSFRNLDDLNGQLQQWLDQVAQCAGACHDQAYRRRAFAEERPRLQRLPAGPFQAVLRLERRITRDGMVSAMATFTACRTARAAELSRCITRPTRCASSKQAKSLPFIPSWMGAASGVSSPVTAAHRRRQQPDAP